MRWNSVSFFRGAAMALAVLAVTTMADAQLRPRRERVGNQTPQRVTANRPIDRGAPSADQSIAQGLAIANQEEAELATLAAAKTQNPKIKQFAEQLEKDHSQVVSQLQQFGAQKMDLHVAAGSQASERRTADENRDGQPAPSDTQAAPRAADDAAGNVAAEKRATDPAARRQEQVTGGQAPLDYNKVRREIAAQCLHTAQKMWSEKNGTEADMCFLGQQVVLHQQMIDAQKVLRNYASPQLQKVIDQSIDASQSHLDQAISLLKEESHQAKQEGQANS